MINREYIMNSKSVNNCVWVDFGDTDGFVKEQKLDSGIIIPHNLEYHGFLFLKRSGIVLSVPDEFIYHKPFDPKHNLTLMSEKISNIFVNKGDIVFYEAETRAWCIANGFRFKTTTGEYIYAVPYRFLICVIKKPSDKVIMLNGKIMVSHNLEIAKQEIKSDIIVIAKKFTNSYNNWCDVTMANNEEGYEGTWNNNDYTYWNRLGNNIEEGHQVLVKKYASFDLQTATKEEKDIDSLKDVYSVERKKIIAVRENAESEPRPYGLYIKVKLSEDYLANADLYNMSESGIWVKKRYIPAFNGEVVAIGCGVSEVICGDMVYFRHKKDAIEIINKHAYIREEWIERVE